MTTKEIPLSVVSFVGIDIQKENAQWLGKGSYGYAWRAKYRPDELSEYEDVVVKVLQTNTSPKKHSDPTKDFIEEIDHLKSLRHPGIVRIIRQGECEFEGIKTLYYLTEWEEAIALDKVLKKITAPLPLEFVFKFINSILIALDYCHQHRELILHLDLKPDNILLKFQNPSLQENPSTFSISTFNHCTLIDFGKAKAVTRLLKGSGNATTLGGGEFRYVHPNLLPYFRSNQVDKSIFTYGANGFDLYAVSIILREDILKRVSADEGGTRDFQFLDLLAIELQNPSAGTPGYTIFSAADALTAIKRYSLNAESDRKPIRLSGSMTVGVTPLARAIIDTPEFQRLRGVYQLGFTHFVYPSATHTRFSHSIGVYHMAERYVNALSHEPLFNLKYSREDIEVLKIRALLHDIGHYPLAHYLEEFGTALDGLKLDHTWYGKQILGGNIKCLGGKSSDEHCLAMVLEKNGIKEALCRPASGTLLDAIISGPVDSDKLDYTIRDGLSCGVPYAEAIDIDRFLASLTWHFDRQYKLAITPKGIAAAETILTARYQLFSEVYWHKTCRAAVAMIKEAFWQIWCNKKVTQEELTSAVMKEDEVGMLKWLANKLSEVNHEAASDLISDALIPCGRRAPYKRIATYSPTWDNGISKTLYNEIGRRSLDTLDKLRRHLVDVLNDLGRNKMPSEWEPIKVHHLLLDMPPQDKSKLGELFVKYPANVLDKTKEELSNSSEVVKSLKVAFEQKLCRVRVFCHPERYKQILKVTNGNARSVMDEKITGFFKE